MPDPDELIENLEAKIEGIPESVKPIPEGSSVPALANMPEEREETRSAIMAGYVGALLVFVVILAALLVMKQTLVKTWPPGAALYEFMGIEVKSPGEGLVFDRVKAKVTPTGRIIIEGSIINLINEDQILPAIKVSVRDQAGQEIKQLTIQPPFEQMKAESTLPFKTSYKDGLNGADHIQLRFVLGDPLQEKTVELKGFEEEHAAEIEGSHEEGKHGEHTSEHTLPEHTPQEHNPAPESHH
ncbi:MAG TPA: hypothetical protein PK513_03715 [Alphaproteobacteria bacterium]|nr:hypothetical protein [Alphaproteobacteria bacterium]